jgi:hypothetical protein
MSVAGFAGAGDGGGSGLASHAAQIGFARGAQMQQQQLLQTHDGRLALETKAGAVKTRIRDVWKHNLAQEMAVLRQLVEKYPYISMVWSPTIWGLIQSRSTDASYRIPSSLALSLVPSDHLRIKPIITTRPFDATLTS